MLVYLDTNIWVYAYESDPGFDAASRQFMQNLPSGKHRIAGSLFVLNELPPHLGHLHPRRTPRTRRAGVARVPRS
jgi:predicted nucleic acid-binding protein